MLNDLLFFKRTVMLTAEGTYQHLKKVTKKLFCDFFAISLL